MRYKEYARNSTDKSTTDKEQKKKITALANKCKNKNWLEMDGNMCITIYSDRYLMYRFQFYLVHSFIQMSIVGSFPQKRKTKTDDIFF